MTAETPPPGADPPIAHVVLDTNGSTVQSKHIPSRKRNAIAKHKPKPIARRIRNASPVPPPARSTARAKTEKSESATMKFLRPKEAIHTLAALGAAAGSSALGASLVRLGFNPTWVAGIIGGIGVAVSWRSDGEWMRILSQGTAGAMASQLVLQMIVPREIHFAMRTQGTDGKTPALPPAPSQALPPPTSKPRAAEVGGLEPGWLDAAFEQARAEIAVEADTYPDGFHPNQHTSYQPEHAPSTQHEHHHHHGH